MSPCRKRDTKGREISKPLRTDTTRTAKACEILMAVDGSQHDRPRPPTCLPIVCKRAGLVGWSALTRHEPAWAQHRSMT
jgi:hypothetical protein